MVLVTGASRGIGAATCAALTRRGAVVVAAGRDETALAAVAAASTVVADAADPAAAPALVAAAVDRHGRLDAVVANAGIGWAGEFAGMDPARITELVDVNLRAPMLLARAALPALRRPGALVFVTSIAGPGRRAGRDRLLGDQGRAGDVRDPAARGGRRRHRVDGRPGRGRHRLLHHPRRPVRPELPAADPAAVGSPTRSSRRSRPAGSAGSSRAGSPSRPGCPRPLPKTYRALARRFG